MDETDSKIHETMVRLYQAAKELKGIDGRGAQSEIARLLDASPQQIKNWESRGISSSGIIDVSKIFGVSASWLKTGQGEMRETYQLPTKGDVRDIHEPRLWSSNTPLPEDEYTFAPYKKEVEFTGGAGSYEIPDYNGFRLPFGKSTLWRKSIMPENVFCCTLNGDSMEPRIAEDAAIAVDTGVERIRDGKIYAFQHDDLFRVKYLYRLPGNKIRIHSENPEYPDEIVDGEEIRVIGRVFWWSVLD